MPRALLVLCSAAVCAASVAVPATASEPPVHATGRRARARPVPAARRPDTGPATAASSTPPRPARPCGPSPTARSPSRGRWAALATSRCCTPTGCAPPTPSSTTSTSWSASACTRANGWAPRSDRCTSARVAATPTSTRVAVRRRAAAGAPRPVRRPAGRRAPGRAERDQPADRRARRGARRRRRTAPAPSAAGSATRAARSSRPSSTTPVASRIRRACVDASLTAWRGVAASPPRLRTAVHRSDGADPADLEPTRRGAGRRGWAPAATARRSTRCAPQSSATHGADVVRFSYAGGRVPDPSDGFPSLPTTRYDASATQADLHRTAARLADLVEAMVAARSPACRSTWSPTRKAGWSSAWR